MCIVDDAEKSIIQHCMDQLVESHCSQVFYAEWQIGNEHQAKPEMNVTTIYLGNTFPFQQRLTSNNHGQLMMKMMNH